MYFLQKQTAENPDFVQQNLADICASVQYTIVKILLDKLQKAAKHFQIKQIAIAGGVSANSGLRTALTELGKKHAWSVFIPQFQYCTDNAAMIGISGYFKFLKNDFATLYSTPKARLTF